MQGTWGNVTVWYCFILEEFVPCWMCVCVCVCACVRACDRNHSSIHSSIGPKSQIEVNILVLQLGMSVQLVAPAPNQGFQERTIVLLKPKLQEQ